MTTDVLFERYYYSKPAFRDGTSIFHALCRSHIHLGARILEIGPGPRNKTSSFLSSFATVIGVDIDTGLQANSALTQSHLYDGLRLPFEGSSFDACVSNYVMEHIERPEMHFREVARVLRPGGVYCFRTPNLWHYVTLSSRCLPYRAHLSWANRLRMLDDEAHDPYPTFYRANTGPRIRKYSAMAGLTPLHLAYVEAEPTYGRRHAALFYPMMLYERIVNGFDLFRIFRMNLVAVLARADQA
ncbi:MAG: class I SAM-dependent methyltransferase [Bryobacteraceae bacterium]|nr:class I SAM-dependent methyltransferase [Bryobacteraceae bacterium]